MAQETGQAPSLPGQLLTAVGWELHCRQDGSDKFYRLILAGRAVVINYGRTGTAGQVKVHRLPGPAAARAKALTQTSQKLQHGYALVRPPAGFRAAARLAEDAQDGSADGDGAAAVLIALFAIFAAAEGAFL